MAKKNQPKGIWKKERTTGRKYSKSDSHKTPLSRTRKKFWVAAYPEMVKE